MAVFIPPTLWELSKFDWKVSQKSDDALFLSFKSILPVEPSKKPIFGPATPVQNARLVRYSFLGDRFLWAGKWRVNAKWTPMALTITGPSGKKYKITRRILTILTDVENGASYTLTPARRYDLSGVDVRDLTGGNGAPPGRLQIP